METKQKLREMEASVKWNKRHLRIVFILAALTFLMLLGHFVLHATGRV